MEHPQVAQAKKEAKRLFGIAKKANPIQPAIPIESLTKAKDIVAHMNGHRSWHEFEKNKSGGAPRIANDFVADAPYSPVEFLCYRDIEREFMSKWLGTRRYLVEPKMISRWPVKADFEMGEFSRRNGFLGRKKTDTLVMEDKQLRCHIAVCGDVSHGARNFLLRMAKIQAVRVAPMIYFTEGDDASIPSKLFAMNRHPAGIYDNNGCHWLQMTEKRKDVAGSVYSVDPFDDITPENMAKMLISNFEPYHLPVNERALPLIQDILSGLFDLRDRAGMILNQSVISEAMTMRGMIFLANNNIVSESVRSAMSVHLSLMSCHISNGYTNISSINDERLVLARKAIERNISHLSEGYSMGYYSSTPTDSIKATIENNIAFCISVGSDNDGRTRFNKTLMVEKIMCLMAKQMCGLAHRSRETALIIFDQCFSSDEPIGLENRLSEAASFARALGYSIVFANSEGRFNQTVEANTLTKVIFGKTGNRGAANLIDKVERWSHGFEDFSERADVRNLKEGDFIYIAYGKKDLVHLPFESLSEIASSIPEPEMRYAKVEIPIALAMSDAE